MCKHTESNKLWTTSPYLSFIIYNFSFHQVIISKLYLDNTIEFIIIILWPHLQHMEVPICTEVETELQLRPTPQLWQHCTQAASVTCAAAYSHARSLTH